MTGQRFGRLVVIGDTGHRKVTKRGVWYLCECECGNRMQIRKDRLITGNTKSCGCLSDESRLLYLRPLTEDDRMKAYKSNAVENTDLRIIGRTELNALNTSGTTGVYFKKERQKWVAKIEFQKEIHYLGSFKNKQDAINARKEAEEKYFNPILEKYGKVKG